MADGNLSEEEESTDIVGGLMNMLSSVFGGASETSPTDRRHTSPQSQSTMVPMATGDEQPRRKSSFLGGLMPDIRRKSSGGIRYSAVSPRGSGATTPRSSFSLFDTEPTPEEKAAEEARIKKHAEESAILDGRLYEFMELKDESSIISLEEAKKVAAWMPPSQQMANWELVYSTYRDGISMATMYRKCYDHGGAHIIFVKDEEKHVFGGFMTEPPRLTEEKHVGTGECFLFRLRPDFAVYKWTQLNRYFMMGDDRAFHMGSGEGRFGLWLDSTLTHGHSAPCETYNNEVLSSVSDFKILGVEVWGFHG